MRMNAVIDRFEGDYAVILLGEEVHEIVVSIKHLPKGAKEGSWLKITFELDPEGTQKQKEKVEVLLEKLRNKGR